MGTLKHSVSWWCYDHSGLTPEQLVNTAAEIGYTGFDLVGQEHWALIKHRGLEIAAVNGHQSIGDGLNKREHHDRIEREILDNLVLASQWGIANLIVFSGNRDGQDDKAGAEATAEGLRRVARAAEQAGVNLVMELLNSKVDHADYQGDSTTWGADVCRMVNSPRVKLLYDIYHMQIMEGDIIRTIQANAEVIAHYHTGGNPGRHEIGGKQELYYPAIMRAIAATGYQGFVGQEFVPAGDPVAGLKEAFDLCNVGQEP